MLYIHVERVTKDKRNLLVGGHWHCMEWNGIDVIEEYCRIHKYTIAYLFSGSIKFGAFFYLNVL